MSKINAVQYWEDQLSNNDSGTTKRYKHYFLMFCKWVHKSPDELIEMKKQALEHNGDRRENMILEGKVKQFMNYLENDAVWYLDHKKETPVKKKVGYGLGTLKLAYAGINSFFELSQYPLSLRRGDRPTGDAIGSRIPDSSEVLQLVNAAKSQGKRAVILFLKDSGLRLSDAVRLRWSDLEPFGDGFYGFKLITQKRKVKALSFVGPETTEALNQLPRKDERIFPIDARHLCTSISSLIAGTKLKKGFTAHGLRKFFNTELQNARVPKETRFMFMGKKTGAYDENRQHVLFQVYRKNYDSLRVFGVVKQDELIKQQSERIRDLEKQVARVNEFEIALIELIRKGDALAFLKKTSKDSIERGFTHLLKDEKKAKKVAKHVEKESAKILAKMKKDKEKMNVN